MIETGTSPAEALLPPPKAGRRYGMAVAATASALIHVGLFVLVLNHLASERGGGGHLLDAIEIEVVDAVAQESAAARTETGGSNGMSADGGAAKAQANQSAAAQSAERKTSPDLPEVAIAPDADLTAAPKTDDARPRPEIAMSSNVAPAVAVDAGASSTSVMSAAQPGSAASAASPGDIARFNSEVRKALGRNRPRGWPAGHLTLAFSISEAGRVENAELMKASASARLNRLTLDWIATVDMPVPPHGLPPAERRYSIPITVK